MRCLISLLLLLLVTASASTASAGEGKLIKVLPQYLDVKGRNSLNPSLYERDAYQVVLRKDPKRRFALAFAVQWKAKEVDWQKMKVRVEMRGALGNAVRSETIEQSVRKTGWFGSNWSTLKLEGEAFRNFGQLQAWRATLWEGDKMLGEQKSFLW